MRNAMKNTQAYMTALPSPTLRGLIESVNKLSIAKSDIVSILKEHEQFILLYYTTAEE